MIKILAIDDKKDNLISLGAIIKYSLPDVSFITALEGPTGFNLAVSEDPDVILLDIVMPDMDGFEVCRRLKQDESTKDIPVVFLTAINGNKESRIKALKVGAEAFLSKPIDETELVAQIRAMVKISASNKRTRNEQERLNQLVNERTKELREQEFYLSKAQEIGNIGTWEIDIQTNEIFWTDQNYQIFGVEKGTSVDYNLFLSIIHPEDRDFVNLKWQEGAEKNDYDIVHRLLVDNKVKWVREKGEFEFDDSGTPVRAIGVTQDITDKVKAEDKIIRNEQQKQTILQTAIDGFWVTDLKGKFLEVNEAYCMMSGYSEQELLEMSISDVEYTESPIDTKNRIAKIMETGSDQFETLHIRKSRSLLDVAVSVQFDLSAGKDRFYCFIQDISGRKKAENEAKLTERRLDAQVQLNEMTDESLDDIYSYTLDKAAEITNSKIGFLGFVSDDELTVSIYNWAGAAKKECQVENTYSIFKVMDAGIWGEVVRAREPLLINDYSAPNSMKRGLPLGHVELKNYLSIPIFSMEKIVAVIAVGNKNGDYDSADQKRLSLLLNAMWKFTAQKNFQEELKVAKEKAEQNERLLILKTQETERWFHNSPVCTKKIDLDLNLQYMSEAGITDLKVDDVNKLYGNPYPFYFFPEDSKKVMVNNLKKVMESHSILKFDGILADTKGNRIWYNHILIPIKKSNNELDYLLVVSSNINTRKKTEQALAESVRDLELAQEIASIGNWHFDPEVRIPYWSDEIYRIYDRDKKLGPPHIAEYKNMYTPEQYNIFIEALNSAISKGVEYDIILKFQSRKTDKWIRAICKPDKNKKTSNGYFLRGTIQDITTQKEDEIHLAKAKAKAEESDRLKSSFLANMSHEIRTPMNGILGFSELLKEPDLTGEEQQSYISVIEKSGERMLNTINNLIEMSKIEVDQVVISISEVDVNEQMQDIFNFFRLEIERKGLRFNIDNPESENDLIINTDGEKLYGIFINLIRNSIKYTNAGSIVFGLKKTEEKLEFFVKDTGIGIPKESQDSVFERFVQVDMTKARMYEGSGLGLAITKANIELLGGEIWFDSEIDKGTTFYFTIPL